MAADGKPGAGGVGAEKADEEFCPKQAPGHCLRYPSLETSSFPYPLFSIPPDFEVSP